MGVTPREYRKSMRKQIQKKLKRFFFLCENRKNDKTHANKITIIWLKYIINNKKTVIGIEDNYIKIIK